MHIDSCDGTCQAFLRRSQARREARPGSVDTLRQAGLEGKLCTGAFTAETVDAARADEREAAAAWLQVLLQRELARADGVLERCRGAHREAHVQHRELEEVRKLGDADASCRAAPPQRDASLVCLGRRSGSQG